MDYLERTKIDAFFGVNCPMRKEFKVGEICPWNDWCCNNISNEEILDWMKENNCPCSRALHNRETI